MWKIKKKKGTDKTKALGSNYRTETTGRRGDVEEGGPETMAGEYDILMRSCCGNVHLRRYKPGLLEHIQC